MVGGTVFGSVLFMDNLLTNRARPFIVDEGRYVYPHNPDLLANWISLDVARIMIHSLDRPDMEGAWMNIGGPEGLRGPQVISSIAGLKAAENLVAYNAAKAGVTLMTSRLRCTARGRDRGSGSMRSVRA